MSHLPIAHHLPERASFSGDSQPAKDQARSSLPGVAPSLRSDPSSASGNAANTKQRNASVDEQASRSTQRSGGADAPLAKDGDGLTAVGGDTPMGVVQPFSELLALQLGEAGSLTPITVQDTLFIDINAATDNAVQTANETRDQTVISSSAPSDTASILAAMLLQIPVTQGRGQSAEAGNSPPLIAERTLQSSRETTGLPLAGTSVSGDPRQLTEGGFQSANPAGFIPPSSEVSGHAELSATPSILPQTGVTQAITTPAISTVMPNTPNHNAAGYTQTITTPLGSNVWAEEFTQKISWMSTQQNQVAELHLNPPDLGPLDVVLKISGNQATMLFTSAHGAVRDAVENALPKLRETLADNGIMLGNATVSDQSLQDRNADGSMDHGFGMAAQRAILDEASSSAGLSPANLQTGLTRRHNGIVDTFA